MVTSTKEIYIGAQNQYATCTNNLGDVCLSLELIDNKWRLELRICNVITFYNDYESFELAAVIFENIDAGLICDEQAELLGLKY